MNRLYAVEGVLLADGSHGGSSAPSREPADRASSSPPSRHRIGSPAAASPERGAGVAGVDGRWIDALAKDLQANRGKGLIVAGERQPAAVHAAVCALNTSLGNTGKTVSYFETRDAALPSVSSLAVARRRDERRARSRRSSSWAAIRCSMPPPISTSPRPWRRSLTPIVLGHSIDETSSKAEWHVPRAHYLESWGDARAVGGTLSVVQPLILPLFGGRTHG